MMRRDLFKASLVTGAAALLSKPSLSKAAKGQSVFPDVPGLTKYVAQFVLDTKYDDIPPEVIALGKKSILDGFGLALAGSLAESGPISRRKYIESLGVCQGKSTVIGSSLKSTPRFAAFVNGVSIYADDFDDTQLAVAKDRVYGLLTHPTAPVLPSAFALAELGEISGKDLMLAYPVLMYVSQLQSKACHLKRNPKRWPAASRTRMPSGTTSFSMPSPAMTAIVKVFICAVVFPFSGENNEKNLALLRRDFKVSS